MIYGKYVYVNNLTIYSVNKIYLVCSIVTNLIRLSCPQLVIVYR